MKSQDEAGDFSALTTYVLVCIIFISMAMVYHGLILFNLRKITKKIQIDEKRPSRKEKDEELSNRIIRLDRLMLIVYITIFILFNVYYFMKYLLKDPRYGFENTYENFEKNK